MRRRALAALVALTLSGWAGATRAQPRFAQPPIARPQPAPPRRLPVPHRRYIPSHRTGSDATTSLKSRLGIAVATRLLATGHARDREQALARLGSDGSPRALDMLLKVLEPGGPASTARDRLIAVRALSPHAVVPSVRQGLVRLMTGVGATSKSATDPLEGAVRESAALALAASGTPADVDALGKALRQEGPVAQAAAEAIIAHPPADIAPLLRARGVPTPTLARLLGRLGDQRAFETLRDMVRRGTPQVRAEAAVALTRLGDMETVPLARSWQQADSPALRVASARILALTHAPGAGKAITTLLDDAATRDTALELAAVTPDPALVPVLEQRLAGAPPERVPLLLAALGRIGGDAAAHALARQLALPERGRLAAYALALCAGDAATAALEHALDAPATRRLAARAAVVRRLALGDRVGGLSGALAALIGSRDAADRAAGAWGTAALDDDRARALLASRDPVVVRAAARAAAGKDVAADAAPLFVAARDPHTRAALAVALATVRGANAVPTRTLLDAADAGGVLLPVVAYALAIRDNETLRTRIDSLLASGDPMVRAATALGLSESARPDATGRLEDAYRFETDARVRRALVTSLGRRRGGRRTLELAARLDGDAGTREAARRALAGGSRTGAPRGRGTMWLAIGGGAAAADRAAVIAPADGPPLPVVAAPDGLLVVTGLPAGPVEPRLAAEPASDKAGSPKP